jgi:hypothetical protein
MGELNRVKASIANLSKVAKNLEDKQKADADAKDKSSTSSGKAVNGPSLKVGDAAKRTVDRALAGAGIQENSKKHEKKDGSTKKKSKKSK